MNIFFYYPDIMYPYPGRIRIRSFAEKYASYKKISVGEKCKKLLN